MTEENKKGMKSIQDMDVITSPDAEEEDDGQSSLFSKWIRDRLKHGNQKRMVEVE